MKIPSYEYKVPEFFGDSNWHRLYFNNPLSNVNPIMPIYGEADLNNQWVLADSSLSPDASIIEQAGEGYYVVKSNSNYHVDGASAIMYVRFYSNYSGNLIFKIQNRGESGYDYPTITLSDGTNYYNDKSVTTTFYNFTVSVPGEHIMTITYQKDSSQHHNADRAYLAIPDKIKLL